MVKNRPAMRRREHHRTDLQLTLDGDLDPASMNRVVRRLMKHAAKKSHMLKLQPVGRDVSREFMDANILR